LKNRSSPLAVDLAAESPDLGAMRRAIRSLSPDGAGDLVALLRVAGGRLAPLLLPLLIALTLAFATAPGARPVAPDLAGGWERQTDLTAILRPADLARSAVRPAWAKPDTGLDGADDRSLSPPATATDVALRAGRAGTLSPWHFGLTPDGQRLRPEPRAPPA
jgi:hypothetical protein